LRRSSAAALLCTLLALALAAGSAQGAAEPHPHVGKLPGYPAMRGVVPVLGSSAAVAAHEKLVTGAFSAARVRGARGLKGLVEPEPNTQFFAACESEESFLTSQDACYRGGPVLRDPTVHLIFWQGPVNGKGEASTPKVGTFTQAFVATAERYFEDVAHDSGTQTNVFAVDSQYGDTTGPGEYKLSFSAVDAEVRPDAFGPTKCVDETPASEGPCLLDKDIQTEVQTVAGTREKGLHDVYVVLTPPGVGGCFDSTSSTCAFKGYCAYHGDFGGDGVTPGKQDIYADLPFAGNVAGCDSMVHPNGPSGVDAAIDDASHELNEVITDPIGSQCETGATSVSKCERNAWTDVIGQEIADKCLPPESTVAGTYGERLGEVEVGSAASAFNQLIDGNRYFTQRVWSNEAGVFEGGCVQRTIDASFTVSAGAAATVPVRFDGSASGAPGDRPVYWVWDFEGEQIGTPNPTTSYTFAQPGEHIVTLTAYDAYGNAQATAESVSVGPAPVPPPPPPPPPAVPPIVVKEAPSPPAHLTIAQLAATLGLPASGQSLTGAAQVLLGHAECPPACAITAQLYARVTTATHGHRSTRFLAIGSARLTVAVKGVGALGVKLSAKGRELLRKRHRLSCQLRMSVEGQEGGTWQIVRSLTLTSGH
jgi:PKD domain